MTSQALLHEVNKSILTITFNRPEKYNALTFDMLEQLAELLNRFRDDDDLRVLMLKANGDYYSAGMDVSEGLAPETDSGIEFRNWYRRTIHVLFDEFEAIEKPIISAIQGPCLGGALEMALSCDFRLAAESAVFALPETNIGALPGSGGTSRLSSLVGTAEAKWMIMAAQKINAQRALRIGLVQEVFPDEEFEQHCAAFAQRLTKLPKEVLGMAKVTINSLAEVDLATARNIERMANTPLSQSKEHRDLVNAFLNRKK